MKKVFENIVFAFAIFTFFTMAAVEVAAAEAGAQQLEKDKAKYDILAKENGFKGLYNAGGIARFLYRVKHGDSLNSGLNQFFWSDISKNDKNLDAKFEAMQLFDGFIIYNLSDFNGKEVIQLTIIVPAADDAFFLEGQRLRNRMHVYVGNTTYTTVLGTERTVPVFKPVRFEEVE